MKIELLAGRLFYFNPGKSLSSEVMKAYFAALDQSPEVREGRANRFTDFSHVEEITLDGEEYREQAARRGRMAAGQRPAKAALYSSTDIGFGMVRMYESVFQQYSNSVDLKSFKDLNIALTWLDAMDLLPELLRLGVLHS